MRDQFSEIAVRVKFEMPMFIMMHASIGENVHQIPYFKQLMSDVINLYFSEQEGFPYLCWNALNTIGKYSNFGDRAFLCLQRNVSAVVYQNHFNGDLHQACRRLGKFGFLALFWRRKIGE